MNETYLNTTNTLYIREIQMQNQNWNLTWTLNNTLTNQSTFTVLLDDEPIFHKTMTANVFKYVGETKKILTFTETSREFSFELFNEFIMDLEQGKTTEFLFDDCDGNESFKYSTETERFTFDMSFFTSNMKFDFPITESIRIQFAKAFRQFLFYYLDFVNQEEQWKNMFVYRVETGTGTGTESETVIPPAVSESPVVCKNDVLEYDVLEYDKFN
jgi:hypothetical protein